MLLQFSKILNLHRSLVIPPAVETEISFLEKARAADCKSSKARTPSPVPSPTAKAHASKTVPAEPKDSEQMMSDSVQIADTAPETHPVVRIKRSFVFGPPEEPHERYRFLKTGPKHCQSQSGWSKGESPGSSHHNRPKRFLDFSVRSDF